MTQPTRPQVDVARLWPGDETRLQAIRLRALGDAPSAFGTTLDEARQWPTEHWRHQLAEMATFVAIVGGLDVGLARGQRDDEDPACAWLISMWVAPLARRQGVGRRLIDAVASWARMAGRSQLLLDVGDDNAPAIACYAALGFRPTGRRGALPPPRSHLTEHQRALRVQ